MQIVGRYHRVRPIGPRGIGAPYVWDRGRAQDAPRMIPAPYDKGERFKDFTRYGEWWRSPEGIWTPVVAGGAGGTYMDGGREYPHTRFLGQHGLVASQGIHALDSAYTYASAGDALAGRYVFTSARTFATVYYFITSFTGTAANVNDLNLELRNDSATIGPNTTLHESKTDDPVSTTGWHAVTGWTFAASADTLYWLIIGDADGGVTDFANLLRSTTMFGDLVDHQQAMSASTTDGWATNRATTNLVPTIVLLFADGRTNGSPYTFITVSTSSTNQRGLRFIAPASCKVYGVGNTISGVAALSGVNLWAGANGPSGTPDATGTIRYPQNNLAGTDSGMAFGTAPTITQGQTYRLVFSYASNATSPSRYQIGTGADATLRSAMMGGGSSYWAEANGTTNWANDNISEFPAVVVVLEDFVAESGGGGGGLRLAGHGGLAA